MDRGEYLAAIGRLAVGLAGRDDSTDRPRAAFLAGLVQVATRLGTEENEAEPAATDAFICLRSAMQEIMWRAGGATWERRRVLGRTNRELLRVLEAELDLLGPIQQERVERAHSAAIAFFLDVHQYGEVARACRSAFKRLLVEGTARGEDGDLPDELDLADVDVEAERQLGDLGRVDISLDGPNALVFVEVKVDAAEGAEQLTRYAKALDRLAGDRESLLVFLTLDGAPVGRTRRAHRHLTFTDILGAWLPIAASHPGAGYLGMYLKTIASHLLRLAGPGEFDGWTLKVQRAALAFLERGVEQ